MTVRLPITIGEFERDRESLGSDFDANRNELWDAHREKAAAFAAYRMAKADALRGAEGRTRDERVAAADVAVLPEKERLMAAEARLDMATQRSYELGHRSQLLGTAARFAIRQMELDTPGPDRAPHWERTGV